MQATKSFRTLVVASPSPKEDKTVTTLNLAFTLAMLPSFNFGLLQAGILFADHLSAASVYAPEGFIWQAGETLFGAIEN